MYATVRRYEGVTDPAEAGRRVQEGFVPLLKQIPRILGLLLGRWWRWRDGFDKRLRESSQCGGIQQTGCKLCA